MKTLDDRDGGGDAAVIEGLRLPLTRRQPGGVLPPPLRKGS
jgi:hypothetical protein